jgi:hypothetical protein
MGVGRIDDDRALFARGIADHLAPQVGQHVAISHRVDDDLLIAQYRFENRCRQLPGSTIASGPLEAAPGQETIRAAKAGMADPRNQQTPKVMAALHQSHRIVSTSIDAIQRFHAPANPRGGQGPGRRSVDGDLWLLSQRAAY